MAFLVSLILIFIVFFSIALNKKIFSLSIFFHVFWLLICFFSAFQLFDLYTVSNNIYVIVLIGNIFFFFGNSMLYVKLQRKSKVVYQTLIDKKFFYVLLIASFLIIAFKIYLMLPVIVTKGIGYARDLMQVEEEMNLSGFWLTLQMYFAKPFLRAATILLMVEMMKTKITLKRMAMIILITFISFICDGGRSTIICVVISSVYLLLSIKKLYLNILKEY